ncbi:NifU family protein [Pelagibacteraceae bacterium]|jgi:Fe-S cluster biogenesis protein NfuA|nr:NifU family protein [Pelagibacteraceae bacterium]
MIQTEVTPNPNSLKFLSEKTISDVGTEEFQKINVSKIKNSFIKEILEFKGVELILLSKNFLSVKKTKEVSWNELKPMVISHLNHYFENNKDPILKNESNKKKIESKSDETIQKIKDVLDTKIRPAVARDGGDIKFKSFEKGVVRVELQGSCSGCPSSLMTLKQGVQNLLKHYVKEVNSVEAN